MNAIVSLARAGDAAHARRKAGTSAGARIQGVSTIAGARRQAQRPSLPFAASGSPLSMQGQRLPFQNRAGTRRTR